MILAMRLFLVCMNPIRLFPQRHSAMFDHMWIIAFLANLIHLANRTFNNKQTQNVCSRLKNYKYFLLLLFPYRQKPFLAFPQRRNDQDEMFLSVIRFFFFQRNEIQYYLTNYVHYWALRCRHHQQLRKKYIISTPSWTNWEFINFSHTTY